jgi:hypothetical protein
VSLDPLVDDPEWEPPLFEVPDLPPADVLDEYLGRSRSPVWHGVRYDLDADAQAAPFPSPLEPPCDEP